MSAIKIFSAVCGNDHMRMAEALRRSVAKNVPEATFELVQIENAQVTNPGIRNDFWINYLKSQLWCDFVEAATSPVVLLDADTVVLRGFRDVFARSFDIGYTKRKKTPTVYPVNCGVVFVKPTRAAKDFFKRWHAETKRIAEMGSTEEIVAHAGITRGVQQAAFRNVVKTVSSSLRVTVFPCWRWNCEKVSWAKFSPKRTAVVHVKSPLRSWLLHGTLPKEPRQLHNAKPVYAACKQYYE